MKKPTAEHLSFMIYDEGYYETLDRYGLTEEEADVIMCGEIQKQVKHPFNYRERKQKKTSIMLSKHIRKLRRVISASYGTLFKEADGDNHRRIDSRAMSPYDIFADGLLNILEFNPDYQFISDEQSLDYIRARLRRSGRAHDRQMWRQPILVDLREEMMNHGYEQELDVNSPLNELSGDDLDIMRMSLDGYKLHEIGRKYLINKSAVSKRLDKITKRLKPCLQ
jgi:hypothetical protein